MLKPCLKHAGFALLLILAVLPLWLHERPVASALVMPLDAAMNQRPASMKMGFACEDCQVPSVHGANVIEKRDGSLLATWFGGSREGGRDVVIWGADYSPATQTWTVPRKVIGPDALRDALGRHIKTVGNSVLVRGKGDRLWLYFVSVSVGGWAGSALNAMSSDDDGISWGAPHRLVTSPFFNVSTLNKCTPVYFVDGSYGLPVYHEFIGKFSELLRFDRDGHLLEKIRITHGRRAIQPLLVPLSENRLLALMRDTGSSPGHVLLSKSEDGGRHWSEMRVGSLPNPDSAIAGLRRPDGSLLLVFNDLEAGRNSLALAVSHDEGSSWQVVRHFEQEAGRAEFSYPYLIRSKDGMMHLVYTWNRKRIRHVEFDDRWVDGGGA